MMRYKHVFFDLDHTLWDFDKNSEEAMQVAFDTLNIGAFLHVDYAKFNEVYQVINFQYWERFRKGFISRSDLRWKRMQAAFLNFKKYDARLAKQLAELYLEVLPTKTHLFDGAIKVLDYCSSKKCAIHLITNGFEETQHQKIRHAGIAHYFSEVVSSERAMSSKPNPAIFEFAIRQTNASKDTSIMIGDHFEVDVMGAKNFGMDQVYFNPTDRQNNDGSATYEIQSLHELIGIL